MSIKEYPSPEEFQTVFGVQAKYDADWLTYEVTFACEDDITANFLFSILTLEITVRIRSKKLDHLITEISIDGAIEILINDNKEELKVRFDLKGCRQELILSPSRRPYIRYVCISASGV